MDQRQSDVNRGRLCGHIGRITKCFVHMHMAVVHNIMHMHVVKLSSILCGLHSRCNCWRFHTDSFSTIVCDVFPDPCIRPIGHETIPLSDSVFSPSGTSATVLRTAVVGPFLALATPGPVESAAHSNPGDGAAQREQQLTLHQLSAILLHIQASRFATVEQRASSSTASPSSLPKLHSAELAQDQVRCTPDKHLTSFQRIFRLHLIAIDCRQSGRRIRLTLLARD